MERITRTRIVPVAVIDRVEDAVPLAEILRGAGINLIEVTFRTEAAPDAIRAILEAFPDMLVGAGTLLDIYQVEAAHAAGARFGVAPGLNRAVVEKAQDIGMPFVPGVMTPSDVEKGLSLGLKLLKFFPAEASGGLRALNALAGPYQHTGVRFIPLGGINLSNASDYLESPLVAAVGGSWLIDAKLVAACDWDRIRKLCTEAAEVARG